MNPISPFSPSHAATQPANVPLPETPESGDISPATALALATYHTMPAAEHDTFLDQLRHFAAVTTDIFFPAFVRQSWTSIYKTVSEKAMSCPVLYRFILPVLVLSVAVTEYQQPGSIPRPSELTNGIVGFVCAGTLVFCILVAIGFFETQRWPWEDDGWVWVWEKWLWGGTVYDLDATTKTDAVSPIHDEITLAVASSNARPRSNAAIVDASSSPNDILPPPSPSPVTGSQQPIIIPPTPMLPRGMRSAPAQALEQIHKSGIIGESPLPLISQTLSGSGNPFADRYARLQEVADWHTGVGGRRGVKKVEYVSEERGMCQGSAE